MLSTDHPAVWWSSRDGRVMCLTCGKRIARRPGVQWQNTRRDGEWVHVHPVVSRGELIFYCVMESIVVVLLGLSILDLAAGHDPKPLAGFTTAIFGALAAYIAYGLWAIGSGRWRVRR